MLSSVLHDFAVPKLLSYQLFAERHTSNVCCISFSLGVGITSVAEKMKPQRLFYISPFVYEVNTMFGYMKLVI